MFKLIIKIMPFIFVTTIWASETLNVCHKNEITELDPHIAKNFSDIDATFLKIYEPLLKKVGKDATIIPLLVKDWMADADFTLWTFNLREYVRFQSNRLFKPKRFLESQDVLFSFKRSMDLNPEMKKLIKEIVILNTLSFSIKLHNPDPNFLSNLLHPKYAIMSKEYFEVLEKSNATKYFTKLGVGNGPFRIKDFKHGREINFESFKDYHLGKVLFDKLNIISINSSKKRLDLLNLGECDITNGLKWDQLIELKKSNQFNFIKNEPKEIITLAYHKKSSPFQNIEEEQQLINALDITGYKKIYNNLESNHHHSKINNNSKTIPILVKRNRNQEYHMQQLLAVIQNDLNSQNINLKEILIKDSSDFLKLKKSLSLIYLNTKTNKNLTQSFCTEFKASNYNLCQNSKILKNEIKWIPMFETFDHFVINKKVQSFFMQKSFAQDYSTIVLTK